MNSESISSISSPAFVFSGNLQSPCFSVVGGATEGGGVFGPRPAEIFSRQQPGVVDNNDCADEVVRKKKKQNKTKQRFSITHSQMQKEFSWCLVGSWSRHDIDFGSSKHSSFSGHVSQ